MDLSKITKYIIASTEEHLSLFIKSQLSLIKMRDLCELRADSMYKYEISIDNISHDILTHKPSNINIFILNERLEYVCNNQQWNSIIILTAKGDIITIAYEEYKKDNIKINFKCTSGYQKYIEINNLDENIKLIWQEYADHYDTIEPMPKYVYNALLADIGECIVNCKDKQMMYGNSSGKCECNNRTVLNNISTSIMHLTQIYTLHDSNIFKSDNHHLQSDSMHRDRHDIMYNIMLIVNKIALEARKIPHIDNLLMAEQLQVDNVIENNKIKAEKEELSNKIALFEKEKEDFNTLRDETYAEFARERARQADVLKFIKIEKAKMANLCEAVRVDEIYRQLKDICIYISTDVSDANIKNKLLSIERQIYSTASVEMDENSTTYRSSECRCKDIY